MIGRSASLDVHRFLTDPRQYERQIDRLHRRHLFTPRIYDIAQDGVSLASMCWHRSGLARALSRAVGRGTYRFAPARVRTIRVDGKAREVFQLRPTDALVHGVVAALIDEAMQPMLSPGLYSYRKGRSWWSALVDCAMYVRAHRRERPDPRTRGLFVLRRDIDAYTDSIPVGSRSVLWSRLQDLFVRRGSCPLRQDWALIEQVIRPEAALREGAVFAPCRGVPTGQPVSCVLFNFYLVDLDREIASVPGAFYARYSDDILFAHPDPAVAREASDLIDARLVALQLRANPTKRQDLYVTAAGRRSADWSDCRAATALPFLGCDVSFAGTVALSRRKTRRLLRDLARRAARVADGLGERPEHERGRRVCAVLNRTLSRRTTLCQPSAVTLLRRAVTDRQHLKQLDYRIARMVLRVVTGDPGVRAFRRIPYRTIRRDWRLMSVLHARNLWPAA